MRLPDVWGATEEEVARAYPCDELVPAPVRRVIRAVSVAAPAEHVYRWLCQVALAPYSYDWIDNLGRQSPPRLVEGADRLEIGQPMPPFLLVAFEPGRSWTGVMSPLGRRLFGEVAVTYAAEPVSATSCRLICRFVVPERRGWRAAPATLLCWGDLVMARRQLLNFKRLAERSTNG